MTASNRYWYCSSGGSDKVYAAVFREDGSGYAIWGKRNSGLSNKLYSERDLGIKISERPGKGYAEITSDTSASAQNIRSHIDAYIRSTLPVLTPKKPAIPANPFEVPPTPRPPRILQPQVSPEEPGVVICENNIGMDDKFTNGVDYLLKSIEGTNFFVVEDMFGVDQRVMQSRFKIDITQTRCV